MIRRCVYSGARVATQSYAWLTWTLLPTQDPYHFNLFRTVDCQRNQHRFVFYRSVVNMEIKGRVIVYSILGCPHCMRAKNTLQTYEIPYTDVSLDKFPKDVREDVQGRTGKKTVPQIFFNARHIGGNDDLQKLVIYRFKIYTVYIINGIIYVLIN